MVVQYTTLKNRYFQEFKNRTNIRFANHLKLGMQTIKSVQTSRQFSNKNDVISKIIVSIHKAQTIIK